MELVTALVQWDFEDEMEDEDDEHGRFDFLFKVQMSHLTVR